MSIDRIYLLFAVVLGAVTGLALVRFPAMAEFRIPPYFLILIAVAAFDIVCFLRARGGAGTMVAMETRFIGFGIAVAVMVAVTMIAGVPIKFF